MTAPSSKIKGCFQCSKRRIICDRAEPTCNKCRKKGIECSGLGRIRFSNGVAQRGRFKGCNIPVVENSPQLAVATQNDLQTQPSRKIRWKNELSGGQRSRKKRRPTDSPIQQDSLNLHQPRQVQQGLQTNQDIHDTEQEPGSSVPQGDLIQKSSGPISSSRAICNTFTGALRPWIPLLNPQARMLMSHFAEHVAPFMVVLDISNGYRDVLLPLACQDPLVQRAVGIVAAQHLTLSQPYFGKFAEEGRAALISRLRRDSFQGSPGQVFNMSTWATLITLLVGETITGSSEYFYLLQTLMYLVQSIDQTQLSTAHNFLTKQSHMFQYLGQPLLGEEKGVEALTLPLERYLDWTYYNLPEDSEHNHLLGLSRIAFTKASQIYLGRVESDRDQFELLESLQKTVMQISPEQSGSHALVWVCFIAAADSTDPEHRRFFMDLITDNLVDTGIGQEMDEIFDSTCPYIDNVKSK
ncbi:uncharacterized protein N7483_009881 [Penicillium malachiteum]|uniref:uncharacterized protein n=1 Tax=Penicillium malachiteum TaxID=1324776 RepID=UPI002548B9EE|nr:uncharacterized protein N7483_009881 [Penicillium malachiteum]KAJ5721947.1 hypothetical protein N7483_009881 [Penicillium malachiteum]